LLIYQEADAAKQSSCCVYIRKRPASLHYLTPHRKGQAVIYTGQVDDSYRPYLVSPQLNGILKLSPQITASIYNNLDVY